MLKDQILVNDEVSLPGFGVFVSELMPACFSDRGLTVNPPYRRLNFICRDVSDTLLAQKYAAANNIGVDTAQVIIEKTVAALREDLSRTKGVVFPGLGRLRLTRENSIFFVPDENLDIYPEGSGLVPVSLRAHIQGAVPVSKCDSDISSCVEETVSDAPSPKPHLCRWWLIPLLLVILTALALGTFLLLCRIDPSFIDSILYTPEELRIINY